MSDPNKTKFLRYFLRKFPRAIEAVADVCKAGDEKHNGGVRTYMGVPNGHQEYSEAMVRHIMAEIKEGPVDSDDGRLHATRICWNALARLEIYLQEQSGEAVVDFEFKGEPQGIPKYHTVYKPSEDKKVERPYELFSLLSGAAIKIFTDGKGGYEIEQ